jgi:SH3 domain protein
MRLVVLPVCVLVAAGALLAGPSPAAETAYVVDVIRVSVRSGPSNDQKPLGLIESGNPVEVLKPGEEWSLVRLTNGTEGYVLSRYLTAVQPAKFRIDQLQEKQRNLVAQAAAAAEENARLRAENERLGNVQGELDALRAQFDALRRDAADVAALRAKHDAMAAELADRQQRPTDVEGQPGDVLTMTNLYWFIGGAGVLLAGFFTGFSVKRQRRWSSSL